jgi:hypothetical protein
MPNCSRYVNILTTRRDEPNTRHQRLTKPCRAVVTLGERPWTPDAVTVTLAEVLV